MSAKSNTKGDTVKKRSAKIAKAKDVQPTITRGFKGFDKDLRCRGFQFEPGKTFTEECDPKLCERGFHFCEYPLDVFNYYPPAGSRFCMVETPCASPQADGDTKRVTKTLTIGAEIDIAGLVKAAFEYTWTRTTLEPGNSASGVRGAAQASGVRGAAQASGDQGAAQTSGDQGAAQASGHQGAAQASGDQGAAQTSGYQGAAQTSGYQGAAQTSGYQGAAQASGYQGAAQASGVRGAAQASGHQGAAQASGYQGAAQASGEYSVALAAGYEARAKGKLGCAICCVERGDWQTGKILAVNAAIVDGETIKADTWYTLRGGEFVEVAA